MKAIAKSNRNLIMLLAGLIILLLVYFCFFVKSQDKAESLESELAERREYLSNLESCYENEAEYLAGIDESKSVVTELSAKLPADVKTEDFILYLLDMEAATGINISDITIGDKQLVNEFDCVVDGETAMMTGNKIDATVTASMDYQQMKDVLNYIYSTKDTTYLDTMTVAYDSSTAGLAVSIDLSKLALDYEGAEYNAPAMPGVAMSVEDLFGTAVEDVVSEDAEEEVEEETEETYEEEVE